MKNREKIIIYISLTLTFIYIWTKMINFNDVINTLKQANYYLIFLATILNLTQSVFSSVRVSYLFKSVKTNLKLFDIWTGGWISAFISSFLPFYSGGFVYAFLLSKKGNISYKKSFFVLMSDFFISTFSFLTLIFLPLQKIKVKRFFIKSVLISMVTYLISILVCYLYFSAFGFVPNLGKFVIAYLVFVFANLIPGAPLKIGQYELAGVLIFTYFFNIDKNLLFTIFAGMHLTSLVIVSVMGILSAYLTKYEFKK